MLFFYGAKPTVLLGHSLGEYVAMTLAGVLTLEDGMALTVKRAELMQSVKLQGAMVNISADVETVHELIDSVLSKQNQKNINGPDFAALNGPSYCVVSGDVEHIEAVIDKAESMGYSAKRLNTSHAFHSSHMDSILDAFENFAENIEFKPPAIKIISNLDGKVADKNTFSANYLRSHLRNAVNFVACVETLKSQKINVCVEVGPQPVLSILAKASGFEGTNIDLQSIKKNTVQDFYQGLTKIYQQGADIHWKNLTTSRRNTFSKSDLDIEVPSYPFTRKLHWIQFSENPTTMSPRQPAYYFQQTLPLENNGSVYDANEKECEKQNDIFYSICWQQEELPEIDSKSHRRNIIVLSNNEIPALKAVDTDCYKITEIIINSESDLNQLEQLNYEDIDGIINATTFSIDEKYNSNNNNDDETNTAKYTANALIEALELQQKILTVINTAIEKQESSNNSKNHHGNDPSSISYLHLVRDTVDIDMVQSDTDDRLVKNSCNENKKNQVSNFSLVQSGLTGFIKTAALEISNINIAQCDIESLAEDKLLNCFEELSFSLDDISQVQSEKNAVSHFIVYRDSKRFVSKLQPCDLIDKNNNSTRNSNSYNRDNSKRNKSAVIIAGGLSSIGRTLAEYFSDEDVNTENSIKHIVLTTRQSIDESSIADLRKTISDPSIHIHIEKVDLSDLSSVRDVISRYEKEFGIRGIIHTAGDTADAPLFELTAQQLAQPIESKVITAMNLHLASLHLSLDFFFLCSSLSSVLGSPGQANYAAANAFLDGLAIERQQQGLCATSINWGVWQDSRIFQSLPKSLQLRLSRNGVAPLLPEQTKKAFNNLLINFSHLFSQNSEPSKYSEPSHSSNPSQVVIANLDAELLSQQAATAHLLSELLHDDNNNNDDKDTLSVSINNDQFATNTNHIEQLKLLPESEQLSYVTNTLESIIKDMLQMHDANIAADEMFNEYGIDSLLSMELIANIKTSFSIDLYPRELVEKPTLKDLSRYLLNELSTEIQTPENLSVNEKNIDLPEIETSSFIDLKNYPIKRSEKLKPTAFILSSPRSGSTLLRAMLAGNTELFSPPELHLLQYSRYQQRKDDLGESSLGEGLTRAIMELKACEPDEANQWLDKAIENDDRILNVYKALQDSCGDRLLVDKSPTYALNIDTLHHSESLFTGAKYIHLIRHPYSVIESFTRMRMDKVLASESSHDVTNGNKEKNQTRKQTSRHLTAEATWYQTNNNIVKFLSDIDPSQHHVVIYEDLVKQPETILKNICEFLEVNFESSMLNPYGHDRMIDGLHKASIGIGDPNFSSRKTLDANLGDKWKGIVLDQTLNEKTQRLAEEFHYSLPNDISSDTLNDKSNTISITKTDDNKTKDINFFSPKESTIQLQNHAISLIEWGDPNGQPVLLLHGILDQSLVWDATVKQFSKLSLENKPYRFIAPDLRGHGLSSHVETGACYQLVNYVSDLKALVEHLSLTDFILVGHSLGSMVSALYAATFSEHLRHLILVETILPNGVDHLDMQQQLRVELSYMQQSYQHPLFKHQQDAVDLMLATIKNLDEELAIQLCDRALIQIDNGFEWRWDPILRTRVGLRFHGTQNQYLQLLENIAVPVDWLVGNNSRQNRPDDLKKLKHALRAATVHELEGGHNLQFDQPLAVAKAIATVPV